MYVCEGPLVGLFLYSEEINVLLICGRLFEPWRVKRIDIHFREGGVYISVAYISTEIKISPLVLVTFILDAHH